MDQFQKPEWSEGMFLTPHHFQQWERYHEFLVHQRLSRVEPLGWGVCELKIDTDALTNGELILSRCSAVLPDGLLIEVPDLDEPPAARPVAPVFGTKRESLGVYLAAPLTKPGFSACSEQGDAGGRPTRFRRRIVSVWDSTAGSNEREIAAAAKNLKVLFEGEPLEDYATLRVAEIGRTAAGAFVLKETYIPPCLHLSASPHLMSLVRRMLEVLSTKSAELAGQRRQRSQGLVEFTMSEAAGFWFLHTVNGFIPALAHYYHRSRVHPERTYLEVARLLGELYTFASEGHPKDVPAYDHENLTATFVGLEETLRRLLETVIPTRCLPIPLERTRDSLHVGRIADERLLETAQFYIAVMANVPEEKVIRELPFKTKISSQDRLPQLIAQALRGVVLKHLPTPPSEIPVQPGRNYFQLEKRGEHWDAVKSSRTMSIYVPPEFTGLKLELMAVKE